ncbi:MAG TPA: MbnP family copper-binding protein [Polyangiaceae bacterium]|nr:MbnP family copper-binding protein [Polyangiaceae bacterium]
MRSISTIHVSLVARYALLGFAAAALVGCGDDESKDSSIYRNVEIQFDLRVNGAPFECGARYPSVGSPPTEFSISDARLYLHNFELMDGSGETSPVELEENAFQSDGLALLDFEDGCGSDGTPETHTTVSGRVVVPSTGSADAWSEVRFSLGVPDRKNFVDLASAAPPLDVTGMFWIWQYGYKFLKVDGAASSLDGAIHSFILHVGASGCPGDKPQRPPTGACERPNRASYRLPLRSGKIGLDLGELFATSDLSFNTEGTAPGCMSEPDDPECSELLPRLGIAESTESDAKEQALFKAE